MPAGGLRTADVDSGVYYGWAGLGRLPAGCSGEKDDTPAAEQELEYCRPEVYPMVMSIGWNPYYKNTVRSVEVHLLHTFPQPFYGAPLRLTILGFIRPEYDYVSKEGLIEDIRTDIEVAGRCLEREAYQVFRGEEWLVGEGKVGEEEKEKEG
ncbi:MAG: riboflavin kinase [Geoglossum umbratile]|nr:MAG: riboflavin kinase [Geoglossum umbratile]